MNGKQLIDEFAMAALTGLLSADVEDTQTIGSLTNTAYKIAIEMMKVRLSAIGHLAYHGDMHGLVSKNKEVE